MLRNIIFKRINLPIVMVKQMKTNLVPKDLALHKYKKYKQYKKLLMSHLFLQSRDAKNVLLKHENLFGIPIPDLIQQCRLCYELCIDMTNLQKNADILTWSPVTLKNRVRLLRELGVKKTTVLMLANFGKITKKEMKLFKALMEIPSKTIPAENLLKFITDAPANVPPLHIPSENLSVTDYCREFLKWYLKWRLEIPDDDETSMNALLKTLSGTSFQTIDKMFHSLHHEVGYTLEELRQVKNWKCVPSDDIHKIIQKDTIFDTNVKDLIKCNPTLCTMNYKNFLMLCRILEESDVNKKAFDKNATILLTAPNEVANRLKIFREKPEVGVLKSHPKALAVISQYPRVKVRRMYLRHVNYTSVTLRVLTADNQSFDKIIASGRDYSKIRDMSVTLDKPLKLNPLEIIKKIRKHPYWIHVELLSVHRTVYYLLNHFAAEDLHDHLQIILYPKDKIEKVLKSLPEANGLLDENGKPYPSKYIVALCHYEMEREINFSGDGIWNYEASAPKLIEPRKTVDYELSDHPDSENTNVKDVKSDDFEVQVDARAS